MPLTRYVRCRQLCDAVTLGETHVGAGSEISGDIRADFKHIPGSPTCFQQIIRHSNVIENLIRNA